MNVQTPDQDDFDELAPPVEDLNIEPFQNERDVYWPEVINKNLNKGIDTIQNIYDRKYEMEKEWIRIDKLILLVFAVALLGALFFSFYMIAIDKLAPVTSVLYPIITGLLGFIGGYFAGSGRGASRGR